MVPGCRLAIGFSSPAGLGSKKTLEAWGVFGDESSGTQGLLGLLTVTFLVLPAAVTGAWVVATDFSLAAGEQILEGSWFLKAGC